MNITKARNRDARRRMFVGGVCALTILVSTMSGSTSAAHATLASSTTVKPIVGNQLPSTAVEPAGLAKATGDWQVYEQPRKGQWKLGDITDGHIYQVGCWTHGERIQRGREWSTVWVQIKGDLSQWGWTSTMYLDSIDTGPC